MQDFQSGDLVTLDGGQQYYFSGNMQYTDSLYNYLLFLDAQDMSKILITRRKKAPANEAEAQLEIVLDTETLTNIYNYYRNYQAA